MIVRLLALLIPALFAASAHGAGEGASRIKLRALLHDPMNPSAELYLQGAGTALVRVNVSLEGIGEAQEATVNEGTLRLFSSATINPEKPLENLAASIAVPENLRQAIALIVPSGARSGAPYRMMLIDDSPSAFPMGESRVINLTGLELACRAGEHRKVVKPASVESIPRVTQVNDMNQAPARFYQKSGDEWMLLSERPTQFAATLRNLFLLYTMPHVPEAQVRTLIDTQP